MGFFSNKKKPHEQPMRQPLHTSGTAVRGAPSTASSLVDLNLDWSKIYVEIDNDANVAPSHQSMDTGSYDETTAQTMTEFGSDGSSSTVTGLPTFSNTHSVGRSVSEELMRNHSSVDVRSNTSSPTEDEEERTRVMERELPATNSYQPSIRSAMTSKDESAANFTITNNGKYLTTNDFANAQLMRWKFAAEEGPTYIQILAFLASLGCLASTLYPLVTDEAYWRLPIGICAVHTTVLCCIILIFEFRALGARNPMNLRARTRTLLTRYLNILRLLWGRGCLYMFTGSMNITIFFVPYSLYTGLALIGLGVLAIFVGSHASFNLERLKMSLTDHSFLWSKFEAADTDKDNLIDISEFSNLVWSLGLELDDAYTFRAFSQIDDDSDARINFREFKNWWIAVQDDEKTAPLPKRIDA